jgi:Endomembrane protein 70
MLSTNCVAGALCSYGDIHAPFAHLTEVIKKIEMRPLTGWFCSTVLCFQLQVTLKANKVTSTKTPLQYDYYDLPFCKRRKSKARAENLGERLAGDSLTTSPYEVRNEGFEPRQWTVDHSIWRLFDSYYTSTEWIFFVSVVLQSFSSK